MQVLDTRDLKRSDDEVRFMMIEKLIELQGPVDISTVIAGDLNIPLPVMERTIVCDPPRIEDLETL